MTPPWLLQLPVWIWDGCVLLGANPTSAIFTVNMWLVGFQLRSAVPLGTCLRVTVVVVALLVGVVAGLLVGVDAGVLLLPPHAVTRSAITTASTANRLILRCSGPRVSISDPLSLTFAMHIHCRTTLIDARLVGFFCIF